MRRLRLLLVLVAGATAALLAWARRRASTDHADEAWPDAPSATPNVVTANPLPVEPLPIEQYDALRAVDIAATIRRLDDPDEVQRVLDYEETHSQRVTVFRAAKARLRALEAASQATVDA